MPQDPFMAYLENYGDDPGIQVYPDGNVPNQITGGEIEPYVDPFGYAPHYQFDPSLSRNRAAPGQVNETGGGKVAAPPPRQATPKMAARTTGGGSLEAYIREAATKRGIDPEVALRIAAHEGGYDDNDPARQGTFKTGRSWWPFQLHYGGAGTPYAAWGNTAGMGNDFTERTGYQPGDPAAVYASIDFALDHARRYGWGAWYGRGPAGVGEWDGIPR